VTAAERFALGGRRAVLEAIRSGTAETVLVATNVRLTPGLRELFEAAEHAGVTVRRVPGRELDELGASDHQGAVAMLRRPRELDDHDLEGFVFADDAMVVLLDGIEDPQNLGACARSAEAAGASLLVLRERRSATLSPGAIRASAGALLHLPVARVTNLSRTLDALRERGFVGVGLDHRAPVTMYEVAPPARPMVLVIGAEGAGISRLVRERCDLLVRIPTSGRVGSLNASAALAAGLFGFVLRPP
jgi:23S rRNA (guanosine2251-2'-O)-methyltransferase